MVQLSPDTQIRPFKQSYKWAAGYRYEDKTILGFSHTHFSGAGHSDLGDVLLTPISVNTQNMNATVVKDKFVPASDLCAGSLASACSAAGIQP